jgi:hypothetical protein
MSLETVGKLVAQHSSSPIEVQNQLDKAALEQAMVRKMFNWLMWGMIILGIGVAMLVVNKNFDIGRWFNLLSSLFILGGTGVASAGVLNAIRRGVTIAGVRPPNRKSLPTSPLPVELPSVTERTTQLIGVEEAPTNKMMDTKPRE